MSRLTAFLSFFIECWMFGGIISSFHWVLLTCSVLLHSWTTTAGSSPAPWPSKYQGKLNDVLTFNTYWIRLKCGFVLGFTLKPTLLTREIIFVNCLLSSGTLFNQSVLFFLLLHWLLGRYAFHLWKPLGQVITEAAKKVPTTVSVRKKPTFFFLAKKLMVLLWNCSKHPFKKIQHNIFIF